MPATADPAVHTRSLWIQYDNIKHNLYVLGCTILKHKHNPKEIDALFVEILDAMLAMRATYRESLMPRREPKQWP